MIAIIYGIKYDTETANKLVTTDRDGGLFSLYQKKGGSFFLAANSKSGIPHEIIPMGFVPNEKSAKEWAERNLTVEQYEFIFG